MQNICKIIIVMFIVGFGMYFIKIYKNKNLLLYANLTIINKSIKEVKEIIIEHNSGKIIHVGLKPNESVKYPIYLNGEGTYSIKVIFIDSNKNPSLASVAYLESGYDIVETINNDKILQSNILW